MAALTYASAEKGGSLQGSRVVDADGVRGHQEVPALPRDSQLVSGEWRRGTVGARRTLTEKKKNQVQRSEIEETGSDSFKEEKTIARC